MQVHTAAQQFTDFDTTERDRHRRALNRTIEQAELGRGLPIAINIEQR